MATSVPIEDVEVNKPSSFSSAESEERHPAILHSIGEGGRKRFQLEKVGLQCWQ